MTTSAAMGSLIIAGPPWGSFVAKGFDRAEPRRPVRGIQTEEKTDADGDTECQEDGRRGDDGRRQRVDGDRKQSRQAEADEDSQRPAETGQEHRLDQELQQDFLTSRAND